MKRKNKVLLSALLFLVTIIFSACNFQISQLATISQVDDVAENSEELLGRDFELEIGNFLSDFRGQYISNDEIKMERRELAEASTEGGEIVRYKNNNGIILRYKICYYGEMGSSEVNYYLVNDYIYYSILREFYSSPIYINVTDILYRTLDEAVLFNGDYYTYDRISNTFAQSDVLDIPYSSLEELNNLFDKSDLID